MMLLRRHGLLAPAAAPAGFLAVFFLLLWSGTMLGVCHAALDADRVVVGQTFLAEGQDPTSGNAGWSLTSHGVAEKLFTVDQNDDVLPRIAKSTEKISDRVWNVTIRSGYKFSDGTAVNAQHVADCLNELNEKNTAAQSSLGVMNVTVVNDLTVRIESERVTHVMDAVLAEWVFVVYLKKSDGNFVFTGPFVIEKYSEDQIDLVPNPFYDQIIEPKVTIKKYTDGNALADAMLEGELDIGFHLPVARLEELRQDDDGITTKSFEVGYHYMMFHNIDTLSDVRVRRAIDLAIDRNALTQAIAGGTATRSLFPDYSPYYTDDNALQNSDMEAAAALLDAAGWKHSGGDDTTGVRTNAKGDKLTIRLVAYPHRPDLVTMQPIIAASLTDLGLEVTSILTGMDWPETQTIIDKRTFDLLLWAQHTLPAGDPLWFLSTFFRSDGGSNHANVQNETVDDLLDAVSTADVHELRVSRTSAAHKAILAQVPVSNLLTPFWHVGLSDRVADYEPWGSDYYVIRADLKLPVVTDAAASSTSAHHRLGLVQAVVTFLPSCLMVVMGTLLLS
jgi:peptide/nickel transport system substrate-binding protein